MYRAMANRRLPLSLTTLTIALGLLSGCEEGSQPSFFKPKDAPDAATASLSTELVERDVEAPEVFQVTEAGLWDGRPSLGGIWVAHPDAQDPERVIIRNETNGKFVIGALFRREREIPGPRIQASSDAASALGMLAGAPVELNVTALRRETVEPTPEPEETEVDIAEATPPADISATPLDPIEGAAAAIETASAPADTAAAPPAPPTNPKPSSLSKPFIQIGIFSVEANAKRTADMMRTAGMIPTIRAQSASGKPFWRVVVGPAQSKSELNTLLNKVKEAGFTDAYAVSS